MRRESAASRAEEDGKSSNARDTHGELKLVASHLGALGAGRKVNLDEMNKKVARITASAKSAVKARSNGKLTVKMGEITGTKKGRSRLRQRERIRQNVRPRG